MRKPRAGVPVHADEWGWSIGFYPGMEPGTWPSGIAATFEAAREAFGAAWSDLQPNITHNAFAEWRQDRDWRAVMAAKRARSEKLDSEIRSTLIRCVCGTTFDSWKPAESYPHRQHIYVARRPMGHTDEAHRRTTLRKSGGGRASSSSSQRASPLSRTAGSISRGSTRPSCSS